MKRTKGFTLIELIAVIIILSIIALITVPVVMNIIERANKSAFKDSAYGIIKAGELYYSKQDLDFDNQLENIIFTFPEANGLDINGSRPKSGDMIINVNGDISLAISNGKYCVRKGINDKDITIDENIDDCSLSSISQEKILKDIVITSTELGVTEVDGCATSGICENGTAFAIKVNDIETYKFYIINDTGKEVTLIMNKNLGGNVAWVSKEDYLKSGGTAWNEDSGNNELGPLTLLKALEERTKNWSNIKSYDYELVDNSGKYQSIKMTNVKARILTLPEVYNDDDFIIKETYLYENLSASNTNEQPIGYWLSTSDGSDSGNYVNYDGNSFCVNVVNSDTSLGIRPVIKISKNL